ncbi:MAG: alpha/beta fold hydrolase [Phenylobacterium sp.]|uniref:alpha/beta fold hydrolase n=1 Tax=Phenylobacterium sp. TaxID=1871053 RepID=UPI00391BD953
MDAIVAYEPRARRFALPGRGGEMAALEYGPQDRPIDIVFCHANGFNARTYRTILSPLAAELRLLAVDMRGHGDSTLPAETEGRLGWSDFRDDLVALLEQLDQAPVVLSGHSMGGATCLLAEAEVPQRVKRLVLFDPVILPPDQVRQAGSDEIRHSPMVQGALRRRAVFEDRAQALAAYRGRGAFKTWSEAQLADYVAGGFKDRPDGQVELACSPQWEASNFASHGHDPWAAFHQGRAPIRILRAAEASTCRIEGHEDVLAATGRVTLETVPQSSHFLPMERPDLVRDALLAAAQAR